MNDCSLPWNTSSNKQIKMDSKATMLHSMAPKDVGSSVSNKSTLHERVSTTGSQQTTPWCSHLGKRKAGHRATSFLVILELVNRKGISLKTIGDVLQSPLKGTCGFCV